MFCFAVINPLSLRLLSFSWPEILGRISMISGFYSISQIVCFQRGPMTPSNQWGSYMDIIRMYIYIYMYINMCR